MKEYLFLFRGGDAKMAKESPEKWQVHMQKWMQWMDTLGKAGKFGGAQPLDTSGRQMRGPRKTVTDGPYPEGKEFVTGYLFCKADSYDEALDLAKGCPILEFEDGTVEVRAVQELKL